MSTAPFSQSALFSSPVLLSTDEQAGIVGRLLLVIQVLYGKQEGYLLTLGTLERLATLPVWEAASLLPEREEAAFALAALRTDAARRVLSEMAYQFASSETLNDILQVLTTRKLEEDFVRRQKMRREAGGS